VRYDRPAAQAAIHPLCRHELRLFPEPVLALGQAPRQGADRGPHRHAAWPFGCTTWISLGLPALPSRWYTRPSGATNPHFPTSVPTGGFSEGMWALVALSRTLACSSEVAGFPDVVPLAGGSRETGRQGHLQRRGLGHQRWDGREGHIDYSRWIAGEVDEARSRGQHTINALAPGSPRVRESWWPCGNPGAPMRRPEHVSGSSARGSGQEPCRS
jgi:hypothetical protein